MPGEMKSRREILWINNILIVIIVTIKADKVGVN